MVRARAGNGMARSRARILAGAAACVAKYGTRKTTMGDIARAAGVAKATLYNHFRDKDELYEALVAAEADALLARLAEVAAPAGSAEAVAEAAEAAAGWLADHPVLRRLATAEPALLVALLAPAAGPVWDRVRAEAVRRVSLAQAAGGLHPRRDAAESVDLLLRWVVSHALWPAPPAARAAAAATLAAALRTAPADTPTSEAGPARPGADQTAPDGLGATPAGESVDERVREAG